MLFFSTRNYPFGAVQYSDLVEIGKALFSFAHSSVSSQEYQVRIFARLPLNAKKQVACFEDGRAAIVFFEY